MSLTLSARSAGRPMPGVPPLRLDGRDLVIGRDPGCGWVLPDPGAQISSRHCEIRYRDGAAYVIDTSTNGTLLDGRPVAAPQMLRAGMTLRIGEYDIAVEAAGVTAAPSDPALAAFLATGLSTLLATRARQRGELGVRSADGLAANPIATAPATIASLPDAAAKQAVVDAVAAIERHHAASVTGMRTAFAQAIAALAPQAIEAGEAGGRGDARDAALWRRYKAAFEGLGAEAGFVEAFTRGFREGYDKLG